MPRSARMAQADEETTSLMSSSSAEDTPRSKSYGPLATSLLGIFVAASAGVALWRSQYRPPAAAERSLALPTVSGVPESEGQCTPGGTGPFAFQAIGATDPAAQAAAQALLSQTALKRQLCTPPVSNAGLTEESGNANGALTAAWKYASDCNSVTYRFRVRPSANATATGWAGEVNYAIPGRTWTALEAAYRPSVCSIGAGSAGGSSAVAAPNADPHVREAALFAVGALREARRQAACSTGPTNFTLDTVASASARITASTDYAMELVLLPTPAGVAIRADVTVSVRYLSPGSPMTFQPGFFGANAWEVCSDIDTWGAAEVVRRRLTVAFGEVASAATDPTEELVAHRRHFTGDALHSRRLQELGVKPPLTSRYIFEGNVPGDYDPRISAVVGHCFSEYPIYDQGSCGCCYATATAAMYGLRKCIADARLAAGQAVAQAAQAAAQTPAAASAQANSTPADSSELPGEVTSRRMQGCLDHADWLNPNSHGCLWYAEDPTRCTSSGDMGQLSYCQATCHTCPSVPTLYQPPASMAPYLYSAQDVALCSCNEIINAQETNVEVNCLEVAACEGGSVQAVWNNWLRLTQRNLRSRDCFPLSLKCLGSGGVVNPLSSYSCSAYADFPTWDRPCSCIPAEQQLTSAPTCDRSSDACTTLTPPLMMFHPKAVQNGLSVQDATLNIQRHILESGPVYMAVTITQDFMDFYLHGGAGLQGNVFASTSGTELGGHAVLGTGWGMTTVEYPLGVGAGQSYWWIRNSWTSAWGLDGYGKVLLGQGVMDIEGNTGVAMMDVYEDWTPPDCTAVGTNVYTLTLGTELCGYTLDLTIVCTEDAHFQIVWGPTDGLQPSDEGAWGTPWLECAAGVSCTVSNLDLLGAGYGLEAQPLHFRMPAFDGRSNFGEVQQSVSSLPAVQGITAIASPGDIAGCGVPVIQCAGCTAPSPGWSPPDTLASPSPAPPWINPNPVGPAVTSAGEAFEYCFPPSAAVLMADGTELPISALAPGHLLLASPVGDSAAWVTDFHAGAEGQLSEPTMYLQVEHAEQRTGRPLLVTAMHLVAARVQGGGDFRYIPAGELRVGDVLHVMPGNKVSVVTALGEVNLPGYAAPLTTAGTLHVEGVLVSSYALLSEEQVSLYKHGPSIFRSHTQEICHLLALPLRLAHGLASFAPGLHARVVNAFSASKVDVLQRPVAQRAREGYLRVLSRTFDGVSSLLV